MDPYQPLPVDAYQGLPNYPGLYHPYQAALPYHPLGYGAAVHPYQFGYNPYGLLRGVYNPYNVARVGGETVTAA